jgi:hypothetical protein
MAMTWLLPEVKEMSISTSGCFFEKAEMHFDTAALDVVRAEIRTLPVSPRSI